MKGVYALMIAAALLGGCKRGGGGGGNYASATETLNALVKPGANHAALTASWRPKPEDYEAVFQGDAAKKVKDAMDPAWDGGKVVFDPKPEQTELHLVDATAEQLAKGEGPAAACPGGWKDAAKFLKPNTKMFCFRFVKPGEKLGYSGDGLVWVNGHWAIFPKAWRALK
jgi:hypothetical protein